MIEGAGRAVTPGEISERMHITSGSITSLVDTLERNGLVTRAAHAGDRRKVLIEITRAGADLLDLVLPDIAALVSALLGPMAESDRSTLTALLEDAARCADLVTDDPVPRPRRRKTPRRA